MFDAFIYGLVSVFVLQTFLLMLLGMAIGFAVGILPGLGGAVTMALMLPFTFAMTPVEAFAFLLGMLSVTATTGDITSVLFGVPGEVTSAATILDGYPMTKHGEAGRALGAALMSSLVGALIGAFALAAIIPVVQPVVLSLGTPEFFMLAMLGIAFVASLSSGAVRRGVIAGGIGLTLSLVGLDPQSGTQRFTFGQLYFWEGVNLVPVAIGLFAIPEIIELAVKGTSIATHQVGKIGGVWQGVKDTFIHWGVTVRCSLLGTFVGMIPGLGGSIGQWLAYAHAVQSSSDKSRFGQGDVRGVLGPGAANNSKEGGNLITTVAFGIPSTVVMAILLGAFLIQGLVPGPDMLTKNLHITFSLVWIIVVSNVITVTICFLFLNQLVRITYVRASLLIPFLIMLIFIGAYTTNNTYTDLAVMLVFGAIGYAMVVLGWPRPPLVLGLVLGKLSETYLYLSVGRYGWEWLTRPLVIVLILIAAGAIFYPAFEAWRAHRGGPGQQGGPDGHPTRPTDERHGAPVMKTTWQLSEALFTFFVAIALALALNTALGWSQRAGLFPWIVLVPTLLLTLWQLFDDVRGKTTPPKVVIGDQGEAIELDKDLTSADTARRGGILVAWILGFFTLIWALGWAVGGGLASLVYLRFQWRESWRVSIIYGVVVFLFVDIVFRSLLLIPFEEGILFEMLGWDVRLRR